MQQWSLTNTTLSVGRNECESENVTMIIEKSVNRTLTPKLLGFGNLSSFIYLKNMVNNVPLN